MEAHKKDIMAFTLAEVLIAVFIFVVAIFAILQLVGQGLQLVRVMQQQYFKDQALELVLAMDS